MLTEAHQRKYILKQFSNLEKQLDNFKLERGMEGLHELRVSLKKIFAYLETFSCDKKKMLGHKKALNTIFKHAGRIRSAQLNLKLAKEYNLSNRSLKLLEMKTLPRETSQFINNWKKYKQVSSKAGRYFARHTKPAKSKDILKLFHKKMSRLNDFFEKKTNNIESLHKNRKQIKNLLYNFKMIPKGMAEKTKLNTAYLVKVEDAIGECHDLVNIRVLLESVQQIDTGIMNKMQRKEQNLLRQIHAQTSGFYQKARA